MQRECAKVKGNWLLRDWEERKLCEKHSLATNYGI